MTTTQLIALGALVVVLAIAVIVAFLATRRQKPIKVTEEKQDTQPPKLQRTFEPVVQPPAYQNSPLAEKEKQPVVSEKASPSEAYKTKPSSKEVISDKKLTSATPVSEDTVKPVEPTPPLTKTPVKKPETESSEESPKKDDIKSSPITDTQAPKKAVEAKKDIKAEVHTPTVPTDSNSATADKLTLIKGLGPKANKILIGMGINRFSQIAAWSQEDILRIDPQMGAFSGRIEREHWVEQAQLLADNNIEAFEAKFGALHR
ncbi:MAG: hypothetical protein ABF461_04690 [Zymomonas mobilis subsp. pomaceae]|uniref:Uncharacterized protein n=1 Tax=Zymomonas mobilis subsp. pomaceae (strain ATCC 29192 / DSM 22645 / JCM 10191 / CCUG 17912 / NBRC 13757 / NCIMB 11200 / NRRL B-4491 / Barker I) TaxID=579138 RepID=F8ESL3_ZYMMT|nr:hypothetical protein [Zymomonas mobilis]AEI37788.1 conserved hypothetical protein-like protein [Zymomonas mobilis subsp. pomaceae ATCC 29192]MDX5949155.1 hypothetical protein [Zymomonas mobilis subsp. pomaceae]GEB89791.1 hypothetical protein ZMO02_14280 [Zymomonas mobilis subsp. pomaceae]